MCIRDRHCGESLADLFEAGSCGGAGQRHILHEQHRTFNPVSYTHLDVYKRQAQEWVQVIMEETGTNISTVQSAKLKEYGKKGELNMQDVSTLVSANNHPSSPKS